MLQDTFGTQACGMHQKTKVHNGRSDQIYTVLRRENVHRNVPSSFLHTYIYTHRRKKEVAGWSVLR